MRSRQSVTVIAVASTSGHDKCSAFPSIVSHKAFEPLSLILLVTLESNALLFEGTFIFSSRGVCGRKATSVTRNRDLGPRACKGPSGLRPRQSSCLLIALDTY